MASFLAGGALLLTALLGARLLPGCADPNLFTDTNSTPGDGGVKDVDLSGLVSLRIVPADAELTIVNNQPAVQAYKALGKLADGSELDVTAQTDFNVEDAWVGIFKGNVFTSAAERGGHSRITAEAGKVNAVTGVTVVYKRTFLGADVPSSVEDSFAKATPDPGRAPSLVYPPDRVLIPPNLREMEIQWLPGNGNEIFEVSLKSAAADLRFYTKCTKAGTGCGLIPDETSWKVLVKAFQGGDPAKVTVRGAPTSMTSVGTSTSRELSVAEEDIQGGLYYWNATPGAIIRYDFGQPNQKAKLFYTAGDAKALFCVGCHAMSRDGKKMAVGLDMPAPAPLKLVDVATKAEIASGAANFMSFSPDASKIITSDGNSMVLRDATTYAALKEPLVAKGTMPDWSPDGTRVVYAEPSFTFPLFGAPGISKGSLNILAYDPAKDSWSGAAPLVISAGENNYYPTYSPDNAWIVFNRCTSCDPAVPNSSGSSSSGSSYDSKDAALWIIRADLKGKPLELKEANGGADLCNSWPKFSPFLQKYKGGKLMWVTFSSRRDYGLRLAGEGRAQIWMAAIDPSKSEMATDPSHAAFWLPFQDIKTGNHIAQWAETVVKKGCTKPEDCPGGEFCENGLCEPKPID